MYTSTKAWWFIRLAKLRGNASVVSFNSLKKWSWLSEIKAEVKRAPIIKMKCSCNHLTWATFFPDNTRMRTLRETRNKGVPFCVLGFMHDLINHGAEVLECNQTLHYRVYIKELESVLAGMDCIMTFICPLRHRYAPRSGTWPWDGTWCRMV